MSRRESIIGPAGKRIHRVITGTGPGLGCITFEGHSEDVYWNGSAWEMGHPPQPKKTCGPFESESLGPSGFGPFTGRAF